MSVVFELFISLPSIENPICLKFPRSLEIGYSVSSVLSLSPQLAYWFLPRFDLMAFVNPIFSSLSQGDVVIGRSGSIAVIW